MAQQMETKEHAFGAINTFLPCNYRNLNLFSRNIYQTKILTKSLLPLLIQQTFHTKIAKILTNSHSIEEVFLTNFIYKTTTKPDNFSDK